MEKEKVQCEVQKHRPIKDKYGILSALKARKLLHYYNLVNTSARKNPSEGS